MTYEALKARETFANELEALANRYRNGQTLQETQLDLEALLCNLYSCQMCGDHRTPARVCIEARDKRIAMLERVLVEFQLECALPNAGPNDDDCSGCDYDEKQCAAMQDAAREG